MGFLVPPLRDVMICLRCSGLRIGIVSEAVVPPCSAVAAIVFLHLLPCSSVSSDPLGDDSSGVVGHAALSSVKALSSPSSSDERSRFSAAGRCPFRRWSQFCQFLGAAG